MLDKIVFNVIEYERTLQFVLKRIDEIIMY